MSEGDKPSYPPTSDANWNGVGQMLMQKDNIHADVWDTYWVTDEDYRRLLRFIRRYMQQHPYAPHLRDMVRECRLSSTKVVFMLDVLARRGTIRRVPHMPRSLELQRGAAFPPERTHDTL